MVVCKQGSRADSQRADSQSRGEAAMGKNAAHKAMKGANYSGGGDDDNERREEPTFHSQGG